MIQTKLEHQRELAVDKENHRMTRKVDRRSYRNLISRMLPPAATLALASASVLVPVLVATGSAQAQTFQVLHMFTGGIDGGVPKSDFLALDSAGILYGTTVNGGDGCCGVVFKFDTSGKETVLYNFTGGTDGGSSYSGVLRDAAGILYGTTCCSGAYGAGVVFKVDTAGHETVLHAFGMVPTDAGWSYAGLVRDGAGNLYGTTTGGGTDGQGTVFKIDTAGKETVLYSFTGGVDGGVPGARLLRDKAGNLYGTTQYGGDLYCSVSFSPGCGVVFELDSTGKETVLHSFTGQDGALLYNGLTRDAAGNLYGVTNSGGAYGHGTVFKLDTKGRETVLYSFTGGADGAGPYAGVFLDKAGNLFGTTYAGGDTGGFCGNYGGCGVVYKLDSTGKETVLHSFTGGDGLQPRGTLRPDSAGNLYGTASIGGNLGACGGGGCGVIFKIKP